MVAVARVALGGCGDLRGRLLGPERKERPAALEALRVFYVNLDPHCIAGLKFSTLVDGALLGGTAYLHDEERAVGPGTGFDELPVGRRIGKHIVERRVTFHAASFPIAHVE